MHMVRDSDTLALSATQRVVRPQTSQIGAVFAFPCALRATSLRPAGEHARRRLR